MSCLLLQPVAICLLHCRSLCPGQFHCLFALLLLPQPSLQGLSPLHLSLLLLLLLLLPLPTLPPLLPLQPKLRQQLLPGGDEFCP